MFFKTLIKFFFFFSGRSRTRRNGNLGYTISYGEMVTIFIGSCHRTKRRGRGGGVFSGCWIKMGCLLKEVCHEIFDLNLFNDLNPSGPLIHRLKHFRILFWFCWDILSQISKNRLWVCMSPGSQNLKFCLQIFSFMLDVLTPKRISPDCPFKGN